MKVLLITFKNCHITTLFLIFAAITEHKLRLEKSLQSERLIYEQTKRELNTQLKEQRDIHDKSSQDLNLRFGSLQQQYKILESQNNDLTEECSKTKKDQLENIDGLDHKVKSLKGQILKITKDKDSSIELWKVINYLDICFA